MKTKGFYETRRKVLGLVVLCLGAIGVLYPIASMLCGSFSSKTVIKTVPASLIPLEGKQVELPEFGAGKKFFVYNVDVDGSKRQLAYVDKQDNKWLYVNPDNTSEQFLLPPATPDMRVKSVKFNYKNYGDALKKSPFGRYILNTLFILIVATFGAVLSSTLVAYGFSRFYFKGRNIVFIILLSTMMLPEQVTLIPSFIMYKWLGWYNTYFPLTVPAFFAASAMNVFLIRQFMMGLPLELDEAAKIDGCGPLRILLSVLIPQCIPVLLTITLNTAIFWWNDYFYSLIYLQDEKLYTVALGLQSFNALYFNNAGLQSAATIMMLIPPVIIFFIFQKYFIQGTVISGVKG